MRSKSGEGWVASARRRHPLFVVAYLLANRKWYWDYAIAQTIVAALDKLKLKIVWRVRLLWVEIADTLNTVALRS